MDSSTIRALRKYLDRDGGHINTLIRDACLQYLGRPNSGQHINSLIVEALKDYTGSSSEHINTLIVKACQQYLDDDSVSSINSLLKMAAIKYNTIVPGISAPTLTITGGVSDTSLTPELNTSAYEATGGSEEAHATTDWQISDVSDFSNIIWQASDSASLTQITVALDLDDNTTYYARARHESASYQSQWSPTVEFNTVDIFVAAPTVTSPTAAATDIGETPTINSSAFAVTNGSDTHASSDWQIASDSSFSTIVVQSIDDVSNLESWTVPAGNLSTSTTYYIRVRHTGTTYGDSGWSNSISFTTATTFASVDISTASYDSKSFSVSTQEDFPIGLFFNNDQSKMWVVGISSDTVYQYTLSTPGDVSTASYDSKSFSVFTQETTPNGLFFNSDQSKMWIVGSEFDTVYQYTLSTPGDVSTASYDSKSFSVSTQDAAPPGLFFNSDQSKMWIVGFISGTVYQYTLSTPGDVSTASYDSKLFSVSTQDASPAGLFFNGDQSKMWVVGSESDTVYQYTLSTPGDVSTASYDSKLFSVSTQDASPAGLFFNGDQSKMWVVGISSDTVYQYSVGTS